LLSGLSPTSRTERVVTPSIPYDGMTSLDDLATKCRVDRAIITRRCVLGCRSIFKAPHVISIFGLVLRIASSDCLCLVLRQAGHDLLG
jgi:hypothetical protein